MVVVVRFAVLCLAGVLSTGCSNSSTEPAAAPGGGLDGQGTSPSANMAPSTASSGGTVAGTAESSVTCANPGSWRARNDLAFDPVASAPDFAPTLNALVQASTESPIAVSNHQDVHCAWMVAFSAADGVGTAAVVSHPATFTTMFQQGTGLWTTAPQTTGWIHLSDADARQVWIPIADVTGSAVYAGGCNSFSSAEASGTIPHAAGDLTISTPKGAATLGDLLGPEATPSHGWNVHFSFSAELMQ